MFNTGSTALLPAVIIKSYWKWAAAWEEGSDAGDEILTWPGIRAGRLGMDSLGQGHTVVDYIQDRKWPMEFNSKYQISKFISRAKLSLVTTIL